MLNIEVEYKKGILFVRLDGSLNKRTSCVLDDLIKKMVDRVGIKYILLNLEKLYSIDTFGINTIVNNYNNLIKPNGKLLLCGYNNDIKNNIEKSDLLRYVISTTNEINAFNIVNI